MARTGGVPVRAPRALRLREGDTVKIGEHFRYHPGQIILALACSWLLNGARPASAQEGVPLDMLLERATLYAGTFADEFSTVIADESYVQDLRDTSGRRTVRRRIDADFYFIEFADSGLSLTVRNVLQVDGKSVQNSRARIDRAMAAAAGAGSSRLLRALADEGARYNLGPIRHNFSDPTLPLRFLNAANRARFRFEQDGSDVIDGESVARVKYRETTRPTLIRGRDGEDIPTSGVLYLTAEGRLVKSELETRASRGRPKATMTVLFRPAGTLSVLAPASMEERYETARRDREVIIDCRATYTNYRRFETSARLLQ